ncbi:MAG: BolA family transcriptional regulator [Rhodobacteraceae bacterium]|jgi:BolA protein|nr:BolA family transcriptional regulator [Paracoccaceae bacterium]
MPVVDEIREKLEHLNPETLEVIDESALHAGHAGARPGGESHFRVRIRARSLAGLSRLAQHRAVHAAVGAELLARIHAFALEVEP